ncbi:MAG: hypothetical protein NTW33_00365 [Methanoregula sp.]|nr:hypothetical protein [Methanoregula sp.]
MTGTLEASQTAGDVLGWLKLSGINRSLPCKPRSKATMFEVTAEGVYGTKEAPSYLVPTAERDAIIDRFWPPRQTWTADLVGMSISADFVWGDGYHCGCIDVDRDYLVDDFWYDTTLEPMPAIAGRKGMKLLFRFLEADIPGTLQWKLPEDENAQIELFTGHKHFLIFGEHEKSTREHPIFYQVVRGFGEIIPTAEISDVLRVIDEIAEKHRIPRTQPKQTTTNEPRRLIPSRAYGCTISDRYGLRIEDLCYPENSTVQGDEIRGICPIHPTLNHASNFMINPSKGTWYNFSTETGGDSLGMFAIIEGLVQIEDFTKNARPLNAIMGQVFAALKRAGYRDRTTTKVDTSSWGRA